MQGLTDSQEAFRASVRKLAVESLAPLVDEIEQRAEFSQAAFELLSRSGLLKIPVPSQYGGLGLGGLEVCLAISELARVCGSVSLMLIPSTATTRLIDLAANEEQKQRWLGALGQGDKLAAFCLTEPQSGSDAASLRTKAVRDGDGYVINGLKTFVTTGIHADLFGVFVRMSDDPGPAGIGFVVVEKGTPGLKGGSVEKKMGFHGSVTQEIIFDNCRIPEANVVRGPGRGWALMTEEANTVRLWGAASVSLGLGQRALDEAVAKCAADAAAAGRRSPEQGVQFALADMAIQLEAARSLVWRTCNLLDADRAPHTELDKMISMSKCFATDAAMSICTSAVDQFGLGGAAGGNTVERLFREAKAVQIFDGTNQIHRMVVARRLLTENNLEPAART